MHELSIALSVVELVREKALSRREPLDGEIEIEEVEIEIGRLSGVEVRTFDVALESAVVNTMLEKARIIRRDVQGEGRCNDCDATFAMPELYSPCPLCGSYAVKILRGRELRVKSILINKHNK
jgi:hydrogenase nickel incorporation protein HypA/HybF